jgi:hypothetical protein
VHIRDFKKGERAKTAERLLASQDSHRMQLFNNERLHIFQAFYLKSSEDKAAGTRTWPYSKEGMTVMITCIHFMAFWRTLRLHMLKLLVAAKSCQTRSENLSAATKQHFIFSVHVG